VPFSGIQCCGDNSVSLTVQYSTVRTMRYVPVIPIKPSLPHSPYGTLFVLAFSLKDAPAERRARVWLPAAGWTASTESVTTHVAVAAAVACTAVYSEMPYILDIGKEYIYSIMALSVVVTTSPHHQHHHQLQLNQPVQSTHSASSSNSSNSINPS
jgi:hypothetical protein